MGELLLFKVELKCVLSPATSAYEACLYILSWALFFPPLIKMEGILFIFLEA